MVEKNIIMISCSIVYMDARVKSYIRALKNKGCDVDIISLKENKNDKMRVEEDGCLNYRIATRYIGSSLLSYILYYLAFSLKAFLVVSYLSLTKKISVVHYNNLPNFPVFAAIIPKFRGAKIILDNHDLITVMFVTKFTDGKQNSFLKSVLQHEQNLSMRFADKVIAADHNQRDFLVRAGMPFDKITVILNVANENWFRPNKYERADKEFRLIYHGTVSERLGLDLAIRAVNIARKQIPNLRFHLIGKGDYLGYCEELVQTLGLDENVILSKCFYPVEQLTDIINKMDAGIIPNRKTEATNNYMLPVKLLEYVYMDIPVIAPRLEIIMRYFSEDMIKYFAAENVEDMAKCMIELYKRSDEREQLVKNANKFVRKYNWRTQEKKYLSLVQSNT